MPIDPDEKRRQMIADAQRRKLEAARDELTQMTGKPVRSFGDTKDLGQVDQEIVGGRDPFAPDEKSNRLMEALAQRVYGMTLDEYLQSDKNPNREPIDTPQADAIEGLPSVDIAAPSEPIAAPTPSTNQADDPIAAKFDPIDASATSSSQEPIAPFTAPPESIATPSVPDLPPPGELADPSVLEPFTVGDGVDIKPTKIADDDIKPIVAPPMDKATVDSLKLDQPPATLEKLDPTGPDIRTAPIDEKRDDRRQPLPETPLVPRIDFPIDPVMDRQESLGETTTAFATDMVTLLERIVFSLSAAHSRIQDLMDRMDADNELDEFEIG